MNHAKKNRLALIFSLTAAALSISIAACSNKTTNSASPEQTQKSSMTPAFKADSFGWTDSIRTTNNSAICNISVDYPVEGSSALMGSVRGWIADQLSYNCFVSPDSKAPYTPDKALLNDGSAFIANIGKQVLDGALPELQSLDSIGFDPGMSYEYFWSIRNAYDTGRYITYTASTYAYTGGAHGGSTFDGQTFSAADGQKFGWSNIFQTDSLPALRKIVKEGIRTQYFTDFSDEDFHNGLLVNPDTLPLPASQPYFNENGVVFTYQQYEIAPYSDGMPGCVIPFRDVKSMMTPEAAALID